MNIEEHMSKKLIEKQSKKDSFIIKISNDIITYKLESSENYLDNYLISSPNFFNIFDGDKKIKSK